MNLQDKIRSLSAEQRQLIRARLRESRKTASDAARRSEAVDRESNEPLAVVGLAFRFPGGATDPESYWELLRTGRCASDQQPLPRSHHRDRAQSPRYWGAFIDDIDAFDAEFFSISPREAKLIDPQHRLLIQTVWHALEDAGYKASELTGSQTGVYAGVCTYDYSDLLSNNGINVAYSALGTSPSLLANRISFLLNFQGPSETIDTACSSSLVALHHAAHALWRGDCEQAIVGASNLLLSPRLFIGFNEAGMLSPSGRCSTFDEHADGYVRGEGVAAILIKPVSNALRNNDSIYGLIRSTAVNHGGKANSLTSPNPRAQTELLIAAYRKAGIPFEHVNYIETHGTGTVLGDPLEVEGLQAAARRLQQTSADPVHCGLSSVKSNIGHLEAAAGLSGLIKVLVCMSQQQLPPTANFKRLNPHIQLADSGFYIVDKLRPWEAVLDRRGQTLPRRAGVSSFGFGGANAHVVLEEYPAKRSVVPDHEPIPQPVVLSARTEEQLQLIVNALRHYLESNKKQQQKNARSTFSLIDIAYTLQVGREAMEERLAFIASSVDDLIEKLHLYGKGERDIGCFHRDKAGRQTRAATESTADRSFQQSTYRWKDQNKLSSLLESWVNGLDFNWNGLYGGNGSGENKPRRVHLPGYPFAKERYWMDVAGDRQAPVVETEDGHAAVNLVESQSLGHPLLHEKLDQRDPASQEQTFRSYFTGEEFFLKDHLVLGQMVLPGVATLEMARAAIEYAIGTGAKGAIGVQLKNITWVRPIVAKAKESGAEKPAPSQIHTRIARENQQKVTFEIYSHLQGLESARILHCQGAALLGSIAEAPTLDLPALKSQCDLEIVSSRQCYAFLRSVGFSHGPAFQGVSNLYIGPNGALGELRLPPSVVEGNDQYGLHPSLLDSALHVTLSLVANFNSESKPELALPFTLEGLEFFKRCPARIWAWARFSQGSGPNRAVQKFDVDLCDEKGEVCVQIKGYSSRVLQKELGSGTSNLEENLSGGQADRRGVIMLRPSWQESKQPPNPVIPAYQKHLVILCDMEGWDKADVESRLEGVSCEVLASPQATVEPYEIAKKYQSYATTIFKHIRRLLNGRPGEKNLIQVVVPASVSATESNLPARQLLMGLSGLLRTARLEASGFVGQLIAVDNSASHSQIIKKLDENRKFPADSQIRYEEHRRLVPIWEQMGTSAERQHIPWKNRGVYLITGGAGGLGLILTREILSRVKDSTVVLVGKSILSGEKQNQLGDLRNTTSQVLYRQVDVTDYAATIALINEICATYGGISGVIHGAGVVRDNLIVNKTEEEFNHVLAPKVAGLCNLDQATKDLSLDLFLIFSSIAGGLGNFGQADYAAANAFMDAYASYRNHLLSRNQRQGMTLAIAWPLWEDGGMQVDQASKKFLFQSMGILPMHTATGIGALYRGLALNNDRLMVVEGDLPRIKEKLLAPEENAESRTENPEPARRAIPETKREKSETTALFLKVFQMLSRFVSKTLEMPLEKINGETELKQIGLESISLVEFTNHLNREYQLDLTPTVLFEHPTLSGLTEFLLSQHEAALAKRHGLQNKVDVPIVKTETDSIASQLSDEEILKHTQVVDLPTRKAATPEAIAVIGISGIFPKAKDANEFWTNLLAGKDCIDEIPADRWDWKAIYGDPAEDENKSNIKWGGFIEGVAHFDPLFFGISPAEAELMDPQQRLIMTYVWKAIEDAGYSPRSLSGTKTAIFVGTGYSGYQDLLIKTGATIKSYSATGMVPSVGPNRMSYFLNFHGPSEPIETACSSSLIAIHRAVLAMESGTCDMAIVGGVNTLLTPDLHISFNKAGMLSEDGRCKTFSKQANGYVRGEGVGMLVLKRVSEAEGDGDQIYGVIRGTAENHGGRAGSLTAPNPNAQAALLKAAYVKAGIDPRTVTYIEAHGTGTKLGDPIEISALKAAFKELYASTQAPHLSSWPPQTSHCGLGSVKTNIGHLEFSAGVAGVVKVLMQLKHRTLVKSLHCDEVNPYIQLDDSPFYIVQEPRPWEALKDRQGNDIPRLAGISSFGFGGANAHVVIEEHMSSVQRPRERLQLQEMTKRNENLCSNQNPAIIVLSAKNQERLQAQIRQLLDFILATDDESASSCRVARTAENLFNVAYTLQVGRDPMEERLGLIVDSFQMLEEKMTQILAGESNIEGCYRGRVASNSAGLSIYNRDEDMDQTLAAWMSKLKYHQILSFWVNGGTVDWHKLNREHRKKLSLPTYPFDERRYWIPGVKAAAASNIRSQEKGHLIHPLLQQNISDLAQQRFQSTFNGEEFFLRDHILNGDRVLPGVAYLEMVRAALEHSLPGSPEHNYVLKNVVWANPIIVGKDAAQVGIGLTPESDGKIFFEVFDKSDGGDSLTYCQGMAEPGYRADRATLDIPRLQRECAQDVLPAEQCYRILENLGLSIGPSLRGIETVHVGRSQVLVKISPSASSVEDQDQFFLHPKLLDAALQAAGLTIDTMLSPTFRKSAIPYVLKKFEFFQNFNAARWALLRRSEEKSAGAKETNGVQQRALDIIWCDESGLTCARMGGYIPKTIAEPGDSFARSDTAKTVMVQPHWRESSADPRPPVNSYRSTLVVLCEIEGVSKVDVQAEMDAGPCLSLPPSGEDIGKRFQLHAGAILDEIRSALKQASTGKILIQVVFSVAGKTDVQKERTLFSALSGLLKTARSEHPRIVAQLIALQGPTSSDELVRILKENRQYPNDAEIRYENGIRLVVDWSEVETLDEPPPIPWKVGGRYLITGGAGTLGLIFAREIAEQAKGVNLILTGRSPLSEEKEAQLATLRGLGARVEYRQVDVSHRKAVESLIEALALEFKGLDGIIHSAGLIRDNFIINKSRQELAEVFAPKVAGLINLDQASKDLDLDFFVLFSSIVAGLGNPGQADYAAANAFLDAYAHYRNGLVSSGQRRGKTLSIGWPLWKDGGMNVGPAYWESLAQNMGLIPMQTPSGVRALMAGLASNGSQVMVMEGDFTKIKQKLVRVEATISPEAVNDDSEDALSSDVGVDGLQGEVRQLLAQMISSVLKFNAEDIDGDTALVEYGISSINLTEFANQLNREYGFDLTPAIFFEHSTLNNLAKYLVEEYRSILAQRIRRAGAVSNTEASQQIERRSAGNTSRFMFPKAIIHAPEARAFPEPIAIVGMSGQFPMARDLDEFWANLSAGKDCIEEIPGDRWDWRAIYGDPRNEGNKTNIKWGGFIDGVGDFDPFFFGISPREAELMDPQQRLLMTHVWKVIEDAGYSSQSLSGSKTAIFVGTARSDYDKLIARSGISIEGYSATGMAPSIGPNRMSYLLNLRGPSEPVETACSSSLVAIHRAVKAIEDGTCDMAIVGGVNTIVTPDLHISFNKAGMLSEDGRCKTFSKGGNGYVRGEGAGMLFLKKLSKAEQMGDHIYGLIVGTAENHGGRSSSLTAPNPRAQADVVKSAYTKAGIEPRTVDYIEAHGTGTELGDPVEINGLKTAFKELYSQSLGGEEWPPHKPHCGIGSVKTNIGHLELAAGVAGVIKVLLQLKHGTLVKSLHCDEVNPYIQLRESPFYIVQEARPWPARPDSYGKVVPRRAGVSSFGFGGANAHVVIEEYLRTASSQYFDRNEGQPVPVSTAEEEAVQNPVAVILSAKNEDQLKARARQLLDYCRQLDGRGNGTLLVNVAYTLGVGRDAMEERLGFIAGSFAELQDKLEQFLNGQSDDSTPENLYRGQVRTHKETFSVINADEEFREAVDRWVERSKLDKLLSFWVKGLDIDWDRLYTEPKPRRVSLPTYPFLRKRCWIPESKQSQGGTVSAENYPKTSLLFRRPCWENKPFADAKKQDVRLVRGDILILLTESEIAQQISLASVARDFIDNAKILELTYSGSKHDKQQDGSIADDFLTILLQSFELIKSHLREFTRRTVRIVLLSDVTPKTVIFQKGLVAFIRSVQKESSAIELKSIGVGADLLCHYNDLKIILEQELQDANWQNTEVQYPASVENRYIASIDNVLPKRAISLDFTVRDLFLITGGAGRLALLLAEHLIQAGVKNVMLVGRSPLSAEIQQRLDTISTPAADVALEYHQADVGQIEELHAVLAAIQNKGLRLKGVVHLAGVIADALLERKEVGQIKEVVLPKAHGVENIDLITKDEQLDYFVLFSSAVSISGNTGQCDYAAANGFLDGFALYRQGLVEKGERHGKTISINWPYWADGGMKLDPRLQKAIHEESGIVPLATANGLYAFDSILQQSSPQIIVSETDADILNGIEIGPRGSLPLNDRHKSPPKEAEATLSVTPSVRDGVFELLAKVTKIPQANIRADHDLEELGLDSIVAMQFFQEIEKSFQLKIYMAEVQNLRSVKALVDYLVREIDSEAGEPSAAANAARPVEIAASSAEVITKDKTPEEMRSLPEILENHDKVKKTIFVLATPRSGSTLLRVMLNGSNQIFSPPELYLLDYETMRHRGEQLATFGQSAVKEGLIEAVRFLTHADVDEVKGVLARAEKNQAPTPSVYHYIHAHLNGRYLVDKTPTYGMNPECLARAESTFEEPVYIYLYRHPLAVMGSFVENRFHRMLGLEGDPWALAETYWSTCNKNVIAFLNEIPTTRQIHIPYESLIARPEAWMKYVCERLGIAYCPAMVSPYQDLADSMTRGLHSNSTMIGDPNFLDHQAIDPQLAYAWRPYADRWTSLQSSTVEVAGNLGYSIDDQGFSPALLKAGCATSLLPAQKRHLQRTRNDPSWYIQCEVTVKTALPSKKFRQAVQLKLNEALRLHESLRTSISIDESPVIKIGDVEGGRVEACPLVWVDGRKLTKSGLARKRNQILAELRDKIDIKIGTVLVAGIIQLSKSAYCCVIVLHHLVADGFSLGSVLKHLFSDDEVCSTHSFRRTYMEFLDLLSTPSFVARLKADWQLAESTGATVLTGGEKVLTNRYKDEKEYRRGVAIRDEIASRSSDQKDYGWEDIAAALYLLLSERNKSNQITIAQRFHGRNLFSQGEIVEDVGFFAVDIPMSVNLRGYKDGETLKRLLRRQRASLLLGGAEYEMLVNMGAVPAASELTRIRLNFQPFTFLRTIGSNQLDVEISLFAPDDHVREYDLDLIVRRTERRKLVFIVRYNEGQYGQNFIEALISDWIECLTRRDELASAAPM